MSKVWFGVLFLGWMLIAGCGARSTGHSNGIIAAPEQLTITGLPGLSDLPEPSRQVDILGPGWFTIDPHNTCLSAQSAEDGANLELAAVAGPAFAVYGIGGFDGDAFPTSLRVTATITAGSYFAGFSNFKTGAWEFTGPYSGSAEIQIPELNATSDPRAFTTPAGTHFFTLVVPESGEALLTALELGVHGGVNGPDAPSGLNGSGDSDHFYLRWDPLLAYSAPDFGGYRLERADLAGGDFAPLHATPLTACYFHDDTVAADMTYRYRVAALDLAGHLSPWRSIISGPSAGEQASLIPQVSFPRERLYGPVTVTFDLSASFDPEGIGIETYAIAFDDNPGTITGPTPQITVPLQPGCYNVAAIISQGTRVAVLSRQKIKVYPRWQANPTVIAASDPTSELSVLVNTRLCYDFNRDQATLIGYDQIRRCIAAYQGQFGHAFNLATYPAYVHHSRFSEAVMQDGVAYVAASDEALHNLYYLADGELGQLAALPAARAPVALAGGDGELWVVAANETGGIVDLVVRRIRNGNINAGTVELVDTIGDLGAVDAAYNPATGMVEIVYVSDIDTNYVQFDPATGTATVPDIIYPALCDFVDIEVNPTTAEPAVLYHAIVTQRYRYRQHDSGGWLADSLVVDTLSFTPGDLAFNSSGAYSAFAVAPGQVRLFVYDDVAGTWGPRNTASYSTNSGYDLGLIAIPGGEDFFLLDRVATGAINVAELFSDSTDDIRAALSPREGQGYPLHGAAGADGLHACWYSMDSGTVQHFTSPSGAAWTEQLPLSAHYFDLGGNSLGEVFMFYAQLANHYLDYWDGGWVNEETYDGNESHAPFISSSRHYTELAGATYDGFTGQLTQLTGNHDVGFTNVSIVPDQAPVWCGAAAPLGGFYLQQFCLTGGGSPLEGACGYYLYNDPQFNLIADPNLTYYNFIGDPLLRTRSISAGVYMDDRYGPVNVAYLANSTYPSPLRVTYSMIDAPTTASLTLHEHKQPGIASDLRCTVSTSQAFGLTVVSLIDDLPGNRTLFEWSNFGDWEELPLPAGYEFMSAPEVFVGLNGRWHIIYRNWKTDQIMCWSTL